MAIEFWHIKSRKDFFSVLNEMIKETERKVLADPNWAVVDTWLSQLYFMRRTTANGRKPTFDERTSITLGRSSGIELQGAPPDWAEYGEKLRELSQYDQYWRTDAGLKGLDKNKDYRVMFPRLYDLSDEPDTP